MSISNVFDIAGTALTAQSVRLNTTASNLANAQSAASSVEQTYRGRHPVFAAVRQSVMPFETSDSFGERASLGVQVLGIVESEAPLRKQYEPGNPLADAEGYVNYPNVNVVEEMANMISASRAFQINVEVMNSAKQMMQRVLTLGQ